MNTDHEKFMSLAIQLAKENVQKGTGGPFGAVVIKNGEIIAASANTVTVTNDPTAHAEVAAIRLAKIDKLYYGATKTDAANIGFDDDFIYQEIDLKPEDRKLKTSQMMYDEALSPFKMWEKAENKKEY